MLISYLKLGAIAGAMAIAYYSGYSVCKSAWLKSELKIAEANAKTVSSLIAVHNTTVQELEKLNEETRDELNTIVDAVIVANNSSSKLQQQLDSIRNTASNPPTSVNRECAAASTAVLVLTDVLRRADERAGELAATADQARTRGVACEKAYSILSGE